MVNSEAENMTFVMSREIRGNRVYAGSDGRVFILSTPLPYPFRAVRQPLMAIILSILKCMFYSRSIKNSKFSTN